MRDSTSDMRVCLFVCGSILVARFLLCFGVSFVFDACRQHQLRIATLAVKIFVDFCLSRLSSVGKVGYSSQPIHDGKSRTSVDAVSVQCIVRTHTQLQRNTAAAPV